MVISSREKILSAVQANQPEPTALPLIDHFERKATGSADKFAEMLALVGGTLSFVRDFEEAVQIINERYSKGARVINLLPGRQNTETDELAPEAILTDFGDVEAAIIKGQFGVAENGAIWVTEADIKFRVIPFICQHLAIVLEKDAFVCTMHDAYKAIGEASYGFGTFIAGPSKTADIEQSLVIGAHGPRSLTVFMLI